MLLKEEKGDKFSLFSPRRVNGWKNKLGYVHSDIGLPSVPLPPPYTSLPYTSSAKYTNHQ